MRDLGLVLELSRQGDSIHIPWIGDIENDIQACTLCGREVEFSL